MAYVGWDGREYEDAEFDDMRSWRKPPQPHHTCGPDGDAPCNLCRTNYERNRGILGRRGSIDNPFGAAV